MATFSQWESSLVDGVHKIVEERRDRQRGRDPSAQKDSGFNDRSACAFWPYSSFFDWQLDAGTPIPYYGFVPVLATACVGSSTNRLGPFGLKGNTYIVNRGFLFVGLNPSRDLCDISLTPTTIQRYDLNGGSWSNFTLAGESRRYTGSLQSYYSSWRNVGLLVRSLQQPVNRSIYQAFHGSYMMDLWPYIHCVRQRDATDAYRSCPGFHNAVFRHEISTYMRFAGATPDALRILCFGDAAFHELHSLCTQRFPGLLTGAAAIRISHYARNYHSRTVADLYAIAASGNRPPAGLLMFVCP